MEKMYIKNFRKFLISKFSKMFIENCMKMKNFEIEKFRFFSISKFFIFHTIFNEKIDFFDLEIIQKISSQKISDELFALTFCVFKFF